MQPLHFPSLTNSLSLASLTQPSRLSNNLICILTKRRDLHVMRLSCTAPQGRICSISRPSSMSTATSFHPIRAGFPSYAPIPHEVEQQPIQHALGTGTGHCCFGSATDASCAFGPFRPAARVTTYMRVACTPESWLYAWRITQTYFRAPCDPGVGLLES